MVILRSIQSLWGGMKRCTHIFQSACLFNLVVCYFQLPSGDFQLQGSTQDLLVFNMASPYLQLSNRLFSANGFSEYLNTVNFLRNFRFCHVSSFLLFLSFAKFTNGFSDDRFTVNFLAFTAFQTEEEASRRARPGISPWHLALASRPVF